MSDTTFVDGTTVVNAAWLNDVNDAVYIDVKNVVRLGADPTGVTDSTSVFQTAADLNCGIFIPKGIYKINGSITCSGSSYFYGEGDSSQLVQYAAAPVFIFPTVSGRNQKHFRNFSVLGNGDILSTVYVFSFPGVASLAAVTYTSGYHFSGITLGNGEKIGGGWSLSDTFRCSIHDIGMTSVSCPINIIGSVVQSSITRVFNNNDANHSGIGKNIGVDMAYKTYNTGDLGPENIQIHNCGLVVHDIGVRAAGLFIIVADNDIDFAGTSGIVYTGGDGHTYRNNYVASLSASADFVGIHVPRTTLLQQPINIIGNHIMAYDVLSGNSAAIRIGDGNVTPFGEQQGAVVKDNHIYAGVVLAWEFGIDLDRNQFCVCNDNAIQEGMCRTYAIRATYQKRLTMIGNDAGTDTIAFDSPDAAGTGVVLNNRCGTFSSPGGITTPENWLMMYPGKNTPLVGTAVYDPASLVDGAGVSTSVTVTGAVLGDFSDVSFSNGLQGIILTSWVDSADTVNVLFQNETGGTIDLSSGTLTARVTKL